MIGFFPDPYPGELLYSVLARFQALVKLPSRKAVIREVLGTVTATTVADLPNHLDNLIAALPPGHQCSADRFIDGHTLLPFYAPFMPPERARRLRDDMRGQGGTAIHMRSGIMASSVRSPEWLRYCPLCWQNDLRRLGERYWRRIHQVPGVEVCPVHAVFLEDSNVRRRNPWNRHEFVPAEGTVFQVQFRPVNPSDPSHQRLVTISRDVAWLLEQRNLVPGLVALRRRYLRLLAEHGLATYSGRVYANELVKAFEHHYGSDFLKRLQCTIDVGSDHNWLLRLVRSPKGSQHPVRHLLLMQFLGLTAETFFGAAADAKPFGAGPWPCLNPAADHHRQAAVGGCRVVFHRENGWPVGTFTCACGFVYARSGPDRTAEDRFRLDRVLSFGPLWEGWLRNLWEDRMVSLREMARRLRVDPLTVKRHAVRLGLPFPRSGCDRPRAGLVPCVRLRGSAEKAAGLKNSCRVAWLSVLEKHPTLGRTALRNLNPGIYAWLRRNDADWLNANLPPPRARVKPTPPRVDWESRDDLLAGAVRFASERIKNRAGRPVRVTISAVGKELGQLVLIQRHLDRLPMTAKALADVVESREQFAVRRVWWAVGEFRKENAWPERWRLVRRAGLRPDLAAKPPVRRAIETAMRSFDRLDVHSDECRQAGAEAW